MVRKIKASGIETLEDVMEQLRMEDEKLADTLKKTVAYNSTPDTVYRRSSSKSMTPMDQEWRQILYPPPFKYQLSNEMLINMITSAAGGKD